MVVILETRDDKRGVVRSAKIKTATSVFDRPITKLCLISAAKTVDSSVVLCFSSFNLVYVKVFLRYNCIFKVHNFENTQVFSTGPGC